MNGADWPRVSVLVPAYNHERFVERCLDSVLHEPYPAKELVIVDDGSDDATAARIGEWIRRHGDALPVVFRSRPNRGVAATLNELASLASGDYLRLGASDDYFLPGGLHAQVRYLMAHPHKSAVIGDCVVVDRDGRRLYDSGMRDLHGADKRRYASDEGIRRQVIARWAIGGPVALLRRNAPAQLAGWREELRIDDWDFFLRLVARDALGFIDLPVCAYRVHQSNLSRSRQRSQRIANLAESQRVAQRRLALFGASDRALLRAQCHYIGAKIAFLQRRPLRVGARLLAWLALRAVSRLHARPLRLSAEKA